MIKRFLLAASFLLGLTLPAFAVNWYVCSTCYTAVPQWAATTAYNSSTPSLVRQLAAPAVNSERVFRETVSTCTSGSTEPTWILTAGGVTASDGTCSWTEATGVQAYQHIGSTTTWTAPAARYNDLSALGASKIVSGDTIFCSNSHAETQSTTFTLTLPAQASPLATSLISVNPANGNIPPIGTDITSGCSLTSTGDTTFTITGAGGYFNGVNFTGASGGTATTDYFEFAPGTAGGQSRITFVNSSFDAASTGTSLRAFECVSAGSLAFSNTTLTFGNTGDNFSTTSGGCYVDWSNTASAIGGTAPTSVFNLNNGFGGLGLSVHGVDFSALTTGHFLVTPGSGLGAGVSSVQIYNNKYGSGGLAFNTSGVYNAEATQFRWNFDGTGYTVPSTTGLLTTSTGTYRAGGNTTFGTPASWSMASTAQASFLIPEVSAPIRAYSSYTSGSHTVTIYFVSSATQNNNQVWASCEYIGSSYPPSTIVNDAMATPLSTPAAQPTDTSTWTSPPATPAYQKLTVTYSPSATGLISCKVYNGNPTTTIYVDPVLNLSMLNDNEIANAA